jgi:hypothetical protein
VDDFRNDYNKFLYDAVNEMQDWLNPGWQVKTMQPIPDA